MISESRRTLSAPVEQTPQTLRNHLRTHGVSRLRLLDRFTLIPKLEEIARTRPGTRVLHASHHCAGSKPCQGFTHALNSYLVAYEPGHAHERQPSVLCRLV